MLNITDKIAQLNEVDRFILLLLGAKNSEPVPGQTHLQKEMYLLNNIFPKLQDETDFEPYLLGPQSEIVADEEAELVRSNLVQLRGTKIELTPEGKTVVKELTKKSDPKEIEKIEEFK